MVFAQKSRFFVHKGEISMKQIKEPWTHHGTELLAALASRGQGLSTQEAKQRLVQYGPNQQ